MTFNLADLFETVADAVPDREALVCEDTRLTFAHMDERATRLAHAMADLGVAQGDRVGVHLANGHEYLEVMLAAFKLRAVPVNVNYRYVEGELAYLFADAAPSLVVREPDLPHVFTGPNLVRGDEYESALAAASPHHDFAPRSNDDLYILYTGGTTGMPKGVMWRHEDIFFGAFGGGNPGGAPITAPGQIAERAQKGHHRCLPACPFMHGAAHWMAWQVLYLGGSVVTLRDRSLDPEHVWATVAGERASFLVIVGDAFARPLVDTARAQPDRWDLSSLTVILSGGAILSPTVKDDLLSILPHAMVVDGFGASETGGQGQRVAVKGQSDSHPRFAVNQQTAVLDDDLRPLAPGSPQVGRLARRGHIPLGYFNDPEKTAATFPVIDGERWAVPGDLARIEDDGTITVFGRGSVSINTGGEKVYPEEVESVLKSHPAVFDANVVGVPDERFGQRVVAVVALRPGHAAPDLEGLSGHCRGSLAAYKCPREMVVVKEIVRSPSGKPDYRWAAEMALTATGAGRQSPA